MREALKRRATLKRGDAVAQPDGMPADLLLKGRLLQADGTLARGKVAIKDGRIAQVGGIASARETLDVGDRVILPGAIDPHVHFRDPGHPEKEDFGSGTRAAALGGVTTVMDMPNTVPPTFTDAAFDDKLARARSKAVVDFGLYAGLDAHGTSLPLLDRAAAMKIYLGATTGDLLVREMGLVRRALEAAARAGRTVAVHAESQDCLERHAHLLGDDYPSHSAGRPDVCEAEAIRALAEAAKGTGARVHVAHLSTKAGLDALDGTGFTSEVCPHHLLLDATRLRDGGRFKMNPPLRAASDAAVLTRALAQGRIDCLASDHAPHTPAEKASPRMRECPAGVPGVQTLVPLLLARRDVPPAQVARASTEAASVFRLPGKGRLAPGYDADLAIYDLARVEPVTLDRLASRAGWSPFEGMPAVFPTDVYLRGEAIVKDGTCVGMPGRARHVRPVRRYAVTSTAVRSWGYDAESRILEVEYDGGEVHDYFDVEPALADAMRGAGSVGAFVNQRVKPGHAAARLAMRG